MWSRIYVVECRELPHTPHMLQFSDPSWLPCFSLYQAALKAPGTPARWPPALPSTARLLQRESGKGQPWWPVSDRYRPRWSANAGSPFLSPGLVSPWWSPASWSFSFNFLATSGSPGTSKQSEDFFMPISWQVNVNKKFTCLSTTNAYTVKCSYVTEQMKSSDAKAS